MSHGKCQLTVNTVNRERERKRIPGRQKCKLAETKATTTAPAWSEKQCTCLVTLSYECVSVCCCCSAAASACLTYATPSLSPFLLLPVLPHLLLPLCYLCYSFCYSHSATPFFHLPLLLVPLLLPLQLPLLLLSLLLIHHSRTSVTIADFLFCSSVAALSLLLTLPLLCIFLCFH